MMNPKMAKTGHKKNLGADDMLKQGVKAKFICGLSGKICPW